jgi:hypothetical protein
MIGFSVMISMSGLSGCNTLGPKSRGIGYRIFDAGSESGGRGANG